MGTLDYGDQFPGSVEAIAFSTDGKLLASGYRGIDTDQPQVEVIVWDLDKKTERSRLTGYLNPIWTLAFHPSGRQLAYIGFDDAARKWETNIWDLSTEETQLALEAYPGPTDKCIVTLDTDISVCSVSSIAYSPDGSMLVAAGGRGYGGPAWLALFDSATGKIITVLDETKPPPFNGFRYVFDMTFSPDGKLLATATTNGVWFWDVATWERSSQITDTHLLFKVAFTPDGKILATAEEVLIPFGAKGFFFINGGVRFWDMQTSNMVNFRNVKDVAVSSIGFSGDGSIFAFGHSQSVTLWDMATAQILTQFSSGTSVFRFSPDGSLLAVGDGSGMIHLWGVPGD